MGLDARYVLAPSLQEFFIDKDSGLPMSGGQVFFYQDNARSVPKPVYEISGNPPNYSYTVLPNPVTLSAVGTFQDGSGNDIIPYYYPYDTDGNIDLYYIEVYDSDGVLQFTREGWPNTTANTDENQDITNFVPNGQFLLHNDIPASASNGYVAGKISQPVTTIGQGGWTFERTNASSAVDIVTFPEYSSITIPSSNPRYACKIATSVANPSDTRKDLCLTFPGVNTFASTTISYNFYFEAQSLSGGSFPVQIVLRKFFGTGGSPSTASETVITTQNLTPTVTSFNTTILFGINTSSILGTNNDDYVQICVRLPTAGTQTGLFTDFALTLGTQTLTSFPNQSEAEQLAPSTAGWLPVPNPDGSDLYLPIILTQRGFDYDDSSVGSIIPKITSTAENNELLCDGSAYLGSGYSTLGVPYSRLLSKLLTISPLTNVPCYGTGSSYSTAYIYNGATSTIRLTTNANGGAGTTASDGAIATGFTFASGVTGSTSLSFNCYNNIAEAIGLFGSGFQHATAAINAGTSGFTVFTRFDSGSPSTWSSSYTAFSRYCASLQAVAAAGLANPGGAGKYFKFSNSTTTYYVWFKFTNETDPTPGGTGIQVNMPSTALTAQDVVDVVREVVNAYQISNITVTGLPPAGSYFNFTTNPGTPAGYYVWYQVAGVGTDPAVPGKTGIKVSLINSETNAEIASKTQLAINSYQFAIPAFQGMFLRGIDPNGTWDSDYTVRFSLNVSFPGAGNGTGTFELQNFLQHIHNITTHQADTTSPGAHTTIGYGTSTNAQSSQDVGYTGGTETRPVNAGVNYFIKY